MRKGRGIDHRWDIRRYLGDLAFYAYCRCGWYYCCGDDLNNKEPEKWKLYPYCPCCGAHKKRYNDVPRKINKFQYGG